MKNFGKLMAAILVIAAIMMTMCVPAMAETKFNATDAAEVQITNLKAGVTVKLYQIVDAEYDATGFKGYKAVDGVTIVDPIAPTYAEVTAIANGINDGTIKTLETKDMTLDVTTAKATVTAGTWLALVTGGGDTIYNPMVVSAYYADSTGTPITGGTTDATAGITLKGGEAVAKSSKPAAEKKVEEKTETSASVGDIVNYSVKVDVPSYPADAVNKTFYLKDTMGNGLTLDSNSIAINGLNRNGTNFADADGDPVAKLAVKDNAFYIVFDYANVSGNDYTVTYSARVNDDAVVGGEGNKNTAELNYTNNPTKGSTFDPANVPNDPKDPTPEEKEQNGIQTSTSVVPVYTYQLAFKKTGENATPLAGAKFAIKDTTGKVVDIVVTDASGYAVSQKVKEGTYTVVEIEAPAGYSLNTQEYTITANKTGEQITATTTKTEYTSIVAEALSTEVVGFLKDGVFYTVRPAGDDVKDAYVKNVAKTSTVTETKTENGGTFLLGDPIPNTKVSELPSTGGMGTTLFVVGGIAVMALAIVLIAANKRRTSESK